MITTETAGLLGKLPVRTDVRTLSLARYVDRTKLPIPPDTFDETTHVPDWPMYANDRIGDCTIAAAGHMIEAWTAAGQGKAVEVPEPAVLAAFDLVKQVDPATGEAGAVVLDVLRLLALERHRPPSHRRVCARLGPRPRARPGGGLALRRALPRPADAAAGATPADVGAGRAR